MQPSEELEKEQKAPNRLKESFSNSIDPADGRIVDNKATNLTTSYMALATG